MAGVNSKNSNSLIEERANSWILDYSYYCAWKEFSRTNEIDLQTTRDFIQWIVTQPYSSTTERKQKVQILLFLCRLSDGNDHTTRYSINSDLTALEEALKNVDIIESLAGSDQGKTILALRTAVKKQAVLVCCRAGDFPAGKDVYNRLWEQVSDKEEKNVKEHLSTVFESENKDHSYVKFNTYDKFLKKAVSCLTVIHSTFTVPYLLQQAEFFVKKSHADVGQNDSSTFSRKSLVKLAEKKNLKDLSAKAQNNLEIKLKQIREAKAEGDKDVEKLNGSVHQQIEKRGEQKTDGSHGTILGNDQIQGSSNVLASLSGPRNDFVGPKIDKVIGPLSDQNNDQDTFKTDTVEICPISDTIEICPISGFEPSVNMGYKINLNNCKVEPPDKQPASEVIQNDCPTNQRGVNCSNNLNQNTQTVLPNAQNIPSISNVQSSTSFEPSVRCSSSSSARMTFPYYDVRVQLPLYGTNGINRGHVLPVVNIEIKTGNDQTCRGNSSLIPKPNNDIDIIQDSYNRSNGDRALRNPDCDDKPVHMTSVDYQCYDNFISNSNTPVDQTVDRRLDQVVNSNHGNFQAHSCSNSEQNQNINFQVEGSDSHVPTDEPLMSNGIGGSQSYYGIVQNENNHPNTKHSYSIFNNLYGACDGENNNIPPDQSMTTNEEDFTNIICKQCSCHTEKISIGIQCHPKEISESAVSTLSEVSDPSLYFKRGTYKHSLLQKKIHNVLKKYKLKSIKDHTFQTCFVEVMNTFPDLNHDEETPNKIRDRIGKAMRWKKFQKNKGKCTDDLTDSDVTDTLDDHHMEVNDCSRLSDINGSYSATEMSFLGPCDPSSFFKRGTIQHNFLQEKIKNLIEKYKLTSGKCSVILPYVREVMSTVPYLNQDADTQHKVRVRIHKAITWKNYYARIDKSGQKNKQIAKKKKCSIPKPTGKQKKVKKERLRAKLQRASKSPVNKNGVNNNNKKNGKRNDTHPQEEGDSSQEEDNTIRLKKRKTEKMVNAWVHGQRMSDEGDEDDDDEEAPLRKRLDIDDNASILSSRSKRIPWNIGETINFYKSLKKFGVGNWAKIKEDMKTFRTGVQLKDRWRVISKDKQMLADLERKCR